MKALILVSGPPGVGKSTLARKLSHRFSWPLFDKDAIDEPFSPGDRGENYTRSVEPKVLQALLNLADLNLGTLPAVILDVPWTHILLQSPQWITRLEQLAEKHGARLLPIELTLDSESLKDRIQGRNLDRDQVKLSDQGWQKFLETDRVGEKNPLKGTLYFSADQDSDSLLREVIARLNRVGVNPTRS